MDADFPPDIVSRLPPLSRELPPDVAVVLQLLPDRALTSLTVPGHEAVVDALQAEATLPSLSGLCQRIRNLAGTAGHIKDGPRGAPRGLVAGAGRA